MRHPAHDYLGGGYFVTFTTHNRIPILSSIRSGKHEMKPAGRIVQSLWESLPEYYPGVMLDAFTAMPDHVHCIVILTQPKLLGQSGELKPLPEVIRGFKSMSARQVNKLFNRTGVPVWQEGYHDRVIRNSRELDSFRQYFVTNPIRFQMSRQQ